MALTVRTHDGPGVRAATIALAGDLDAPGGKIARKALSGTIAEGRTDVTVNLDRVGFLDSSGLGSLIAALRLARDRGGDVRVETSNERIRRILEVTALARVFKLRRSNEIAA
ncbi:MAG TPA: STAS domain-containing protein [Candidatus Eremiobacteraceae bacterium]|nr:STAS domain-containing protein [Candidatus Eremiobacteraceae bacterium]